MQRNGSRRQFKQQKAIDDNDLLLVSVNYFNSLGFAPG